MNKIIIKIFQIAIVVMIVSSCDNLNSPNEFNNNYSILFNLTVNQNKQELYIYRTTNFNDKNDDDLSAYFEKNAKIVLENDSHTYSNFIVQEAPYNWLRQKGFYYTNNEELNLQPNTKYSLKIDLGTEFIQSSTTTPGDFRILFPVNNYKITIDQLRNSNQIEIKWQKSKNAFGYTGKIYEINYFTFEDSTYKSENEISFITQDTTFLYTNDFFNKGSITISIFAYDKNFSEFVVNEKIVENLEGAYGYFGSSVLKTVTVNIE